MLAVWSSSLDTVKYLLTQEVSLEEKNLKGETALLLSIRCGSHPEICQLLVEAGAYINHRYVVTNYHGTILFNLSFGGLVSMSVVGFNTKNTNKNNTRFLRFSCGASQPHFISILSILLTQKSIVSYTQGQRPA